MPDRWVKVASAAGVAPGQFIRVDLEGREALLYNVDGRFYCTGALCAHQGRSMATGTLEGSRLTCPWHAWIFDVTNGCSPYTLRAAIACLPVKVEGDDVFVGL
jgi:nitrite reductase/ring-hydroxylating ferredoxin subunit